MAESELPDFPVSPSKFDVAAKAAGFTTLNSNTLLSLGFVGDAVKKMGALKIGRSKLLLSDEQLNETWSLCREMVDPHATAKDGLELTIEQKLAALSVMAQVGKVRVSAASDMIKSAAVDMSDSAKPAGGIPSFIPQQKSIPVVTADVVLEERISKAKQKE